MKKLLYSCILMLTLGCKQRFEPQITQPVNGYLVVDGTINSGTGPTTIRLSRAILLADSTRPKNERNAIVRVEGENNTQFPLIEMSPGIYIASQLTLNANVKYRLYIKTADNKEYRSDFTSVIKTPAIDAIRWEQPANGLDIYVNAHDPQNNTRYYRWEWSETWEFHSAYTTQLDYTKNNLGEVTGVKYKYPDQAIDTNVYVCWKTEPSTNILIGSTAKLVKDSVDLPLHFIPRASQKISVLYSINVRQNALSKNGYDFLSRMKKNTESTGTLFDAQPSELVGNIHAVNNPLEVVIGFIDVADVHEKRIFIQPSDLDNWGYRSGCTETLVPNIPDSVRAYSYLTPTMAAETSPTGAIISFYGSDIACVICTLTGVHQKPSFWPR
ncbi:MAG: DUF4249 domain-containing protein [Niastella sp.]|nr:DUF4249 domain-containing protein [Niastella sp.]